MTLRAVIKVVEQADGTKKYQPCLMRCVPGAGPSAGDLVVPEICFFDTLEEANKKAEEMLEELLGIMQSIAEGLGNGD